MMIVGVFIVTDLLASKKGDAWIKHELVLALFYTEIQVVLAWVIPRFRIDEGAATFYLWDWINE